MLNEGKKTTDNQTNDSDKWIMIPLVEFVKMIVNAYIFNK